MFQHKKRQPKTHRKAYQRIVLAVVVLLGISGLYFGFGERTQGSSAQPAAISDDPNVESTYLGRYVSTDEQWFAGPRSRDSVLIFKKDRSCFASIDRPSSTPDAAAAIASYETGLRSRGLRVAKLADSLMTVRLLQGKQSKYTLHNYEVTGTQEPDGAYVGQSLGYAQYGSRWLHVIANCTDAASLASAQRALNQIEIQN